MSQTVVGFFKDQSEARQALEQLQSTGISRERIDISRGSDEGGTANRSSQSNEVNPVSGSAKDENSVRKTADDRTVDREGRNTNVFTDFFNNLFGSKDNDDDNDNESSRYTNMAQRSGAVVTVHAQSRQEAEAAAEIMDDCGALDVDESTSPGSSSGQRSRIFDRRLENNMRLRDSDSSF